jgi:Leucine-rich repeat (LRR) protein
MTVINFIKRIFRFKSKNVLVKDNQNNIYEIDKNLYYKLNIFDCFNRSLVEILFIPNNVHSIYFQDNELTLLPELPKNLKTLWCFNNKLTSLPKLPKKLRVLTCYNNKIKQLPNLKKCEQLKEIRCDIQCFEHYMLEMENAEFQFYC